MQVEPHQIMLSKVENYLQKKVLNGQKPKKTRFSIVKAQEELIVEEDDKDDE